MKLAIGVGIFVLMGVPCGAHAQSQGDSQTLIMAPPAPKPAIVDANSTAIEDRETIKLIDQAKKTISQTSLFVKCIDMLPKLKDVAKYNSFLQKTIEHLKVLSDILKTISLGVNISTGNKDGVIDNIQDVVVNYGMCGFGPVVCAQYKKWYTIGSAINYAPKLLYWDVNEQTIKEVVTDFYAPMWGDVANGKTVAQVEAAIEQVRADAVKARAGAQYALDNAETCKMEERKNAVRDLLAKAKADAAAARMTSSSSGLSAETDAAINDGRARAYRANAEGSAQFISTMQAQQQQVLQKRAQAQAAQEALTMPFCNGWKADGYHPCDGTITYPAPAATAQKGSMPTSTTPQPSEGCVLTAADMAEGKVCVGN